MLHQREMRVTDLLNEKKDVLDAVAARLLEKEVIVEDEFMKMVNPNE